ncbi:unnamed protein product [Moneuplotes crassus]|uniref:Uncharacterized protein n=1 Tax=Euplotes crassus TaxID=5936 RepID=A0AAD2D4H8_EUPCR|nr:unnamed protein product [Moneuplotes crassus]
MSDKKDLAQKVKELKEEAHTEAVKAADQAKAALQNLTEKHGSNHQEKSDLRFDYGILDYLYPPKTEEELTHKYSVLRRNMMGENVTSASKESKSLSDLVHGVRKSIRDTREGLQNGTGLNIRFILTPIISLLPLFIFSSRRPRRVFYTYTFMSYLLCPEPWRAIYNAK